MGIPWDNVAAAIIGGLVGAALRPYVERFIPVPGRMKRVRLTVDRAWTDHERWVEKHLDELEGELRRIDEDHSARGLYDSGIRIEARERMRRRYLHDLGDKQRATFRKAEDALNELGPLERLWIRWRLRKNEYPDPSVERRLFDPGDKGLAG